MASSSGEPIDCVIYQSRTGYEDDAPALLSDAQRALPSLYIEHDPPRPYPVDTAHWFRHDRGILVHVTHYNALNWDAGPMPVERRSGHAGRALAVSGLAVALIAGGAIFTVKSMDGRRVAGVRVHRAPSVMAPTQA